MLYNFESDLMKSIVDRISKELDEFEEDMLNKTKREIYNECYKIYFYENVASFLCDCCDFDDETCEKFISFEPNILGSMFNFYLDCEGYNIENGEDESIFVQDFIRYYLNDGDNTGGDLYYV